MKVIHKEILFQTSEQVAIVPIGALHLDIQMQKNYVTLWYLCDPEETGTQTLTLRMCGTGEELEDDFLHNYYWIKTIQEHDYVWHWFLKR